MRASFGSSGSAGPAEYQVFSQVAEGFQAGLSEQSPDVQEELFQIDSALNSPLDG